MISVPFAAALTASVLSTSFVSGVFGMAGGMILMGLLLSLMPLAPAMALHGITQIASNAARAWLNSAVVQELVVISKMSTLDEEVDEGVPGIYPPANNILLPAEATAT